MKRKKRVFGEFKLEPVTEVEKIPIGKIEMFKPTVIYGPSGKIVAGKPKKRSKRKPKQTSLASIEANDNLPSFFCSIVTA